MKKVTISISLFAFILLIYLFWWFQIRPAQIRHFCSQFSDMDVVTEIEATRSYYKYPAKKTIHNPYEDCLHKKGLK